MNSNTSTTNLATRQTILAAQPDTHILFARLPTQSEIQALQDDYARKTEELIAMIPGWFIVPEMEFHGDDGMKQTQITEFWTVKTTDGPGR